MNRISYARRASNKIRLFLSAVLLLLALPALAAQPEIVGSIYALNAADWSAYPVLSLTAYYSGGTTGGGTLVYVSSDTTSPTDYCTIFIDSAGHRFYRELNGTPLDVTMCGAHWDGSTDDASAINYAYVAAARIGRALTCPGGTGKIGSTITPQPGVILRCQGMETSFINGSSVTGPCFYLQNANGTVEVQAPSFYDFSLTCGGTFAIQLNSVAGGFLDNPTTQSYMMRPRLENLDLSGGSTAVFQCSKCFDGDISLSKFSSGGMGIDLEGSDWISIGGKGPNRLVSLSGYPVSLVSHNTFGNGDSVVHNDILAPATGVGAYIYSSARESFIRDNFLEGSTSGACEIKIDAGTLTATVTNNWVTDSSVSNWLCVPSNVVSLVATGNGTSNVGAGAALFNGGNGTNLWYNTILRQTIVHNGNYSDGGFPFNTQVSGSGTFGNKVLFDATPSTAENISNGDYAASLLIKNNAYVLPAISSYGSLIDFTNMSRTITGTVNACFYASTTVNGTSLYAQYLDGGVPISNTSFTLSTVPKWYCWNGLAPSTGATFKTWNQDTTNNGNDYLYELTVTQQ